LFGWDEDELLDPLEELGWLPPPPTLGGAGALGVGTEGGGGTEGACTEGVGTDGVGRDGASTDGDPPEGHETVATGVWTQSWARTGKTAAAKAAIAIALPMSRALLFMPAASPPYRFLATAANRVRRYRNLFRDAPAPGTWSWVFERGWFSVGGLESLRNDSHPRVEGERPKSEKMVCFRALESRRPNATRGDDRMAEDDEGLRQRLTRQGEEAVGKLAQDLLENPLFANTLAHAFEAREKAVQAQTVAMGALNLPSAADIERLTRRLRSVSQRLEGLEDGVERLDERLADVSAASDTAERLRRIEEQLQGLTAEVQGLAKRLPEESEPVSRDQERLEVPGEG
jgi:hypothetical protein